MHWRRQCEALRRIVCFTDTVRDYQYTAPTNCMKSFHWMSQRPSHHQERQTYVRPWTQRKAASRRGSEDGTHTKVVGSMETCTEPSIHCRASFCRCGLNNLAKCNRKKPLTLRDFQSSSSSSPLLTEGFQPAPYCDIIPVNKNTSNVPARLSGVGVDQAGDCQASK